MGGVSGWKLRTRILLRTTQVRVGVIVGPMARLDETEHGAARHGCRWSEAAGRDVTSCSRLWGWRRTTGQAFEEDEVSWKDE